MLRAPSLLLSGIAVCVIGLHSAPGQEPDKRERPRIPGGIEGHIKSVDADKATITVVTDAGSERTFNLTEDTMMLGPRGGKVRRRLHDPRFHEGMELTVVATGSTAKEVHLGYSPRQREAAKSGAEAGAKPSSRPKSQPAGKASTVPAEKAKSGARKGEAITRKPSPTEEEDEDSELPGVVKSYNTERRVLVVTLLNGANRTFILSRDLKVMVGRAQSKQGVADPVLKEGAHVTVFLEEGSHRVRELHVEPASAVRKTKKAA